MISDLLIMNGYGFYIWLSFGLVAASCILVYLRTKKTLRKYEKEFFFELEELSKEQKKIVLEKSKIANQIYITSNKIN